MEHEKTEYSFLDKLYIFNSKHKNDFGYKLVKASFISTLALLSLTSFSCTSSKPSITQVMK